MTEWIKTHDLTTRCLHFKYKIQQTESKRVEKNQVDAIQKKVGVAILILYKDDFRAKKTTGGRDGHYIIITRSIHQEDTAVQNKCAPDNSYKLHETKTDRTRRNRQIHINSWRLQQPSFNS